MHFKVSSALCFKLDRSKILSFGNGLNILSSDALNLDHCKILLFCKELKKIQFSSAQELLSQWMEEKVHLQNHLDPEIDCNYDEDDWQRYEIESDVKKQWDKMLANNYDEYGLSFSEDPREKYSGMS